MVQVCIRMHPVQIVLDIDAIMAEFKFYDNVSFSDSRSESLAIFFSKCNLLIAGNSSIHLEAATSGLETIYYEFTKKSYHDYYGYVSSGLSKHINSIEMLQRYLSSRDHNHSVSKIQACAARKIAIKYYSESYDTKWKGKEGELVGTTLERLRVGKPLADIYRTLESNVPFLSVNRLAG